MKTFLKITIIAISLIRVSAFADPETVSLEQLVSELVKNNPDIQAAENRYEAAQARPRQMGSLPDPVLSFVSRNGSANPAPFTELERIL